MDTVPAPEVTVDDFSQFSGILSLTEYEQDRLTVLLGRARRNLADEVTLPDVLTELELLDWADGVAQLAWLYWESEKSGTMEILALPVSQLSLGTLFWTKEAKTNLAGLPAVDRLLVKYGNTKHRRFVLEGDLDYPE